MFCSTEPLRLAESRHFQIARGLGVVGPVSRETVSAKLTVSIPNNAIIGP